MELDDLKHEWQQAGIEQPKHENIMTLIKNQSSGPLAALKRSFRRGVTAMSLVLVFIIATNIQNIEKTFSSALFWFYVMFYLCVVLFAAVNYRVVQRMEQIDGALKSRLEQQVYLLERRLRQNIIGIRAGLLLFIVLLEVLPYFQKFSMLTTWNSLSPVARFGAYGALLTFQYFISRIVSRRKFGQHIAYLKELVKQME